MTQLAPLIADSLTRTYAGHAVVDAASLRLEPGKITALLGKSGAGKSTLLRLLAGLERPDRGEIWLGDAVLSNDSKMVPAEKRRIGLIFQDFALFPHLTALQNIMFGLTNLPKHEAKTLALDWLTRVNLAARARAFPHELSGGEQQRIAIARALAPRPVAILMDEPFSGLDPALREEVRFTALEAIRASGTPALLVTHDASEAMLSADHLAVMRDGKIIQQGPPETIYTQPVDRETAAALGPIILLSGRAGQNPDTIDTPFGSFHARGQILSGLISVGIRPEAFLIDAGSPVKAKVIAARRNGPMRQLHIERQGATAFILVPAQNHAQPGQDIGITLDPAGCSIFGQSHLI